MLDEKNQKLVPESKYKEILRLLDPDSNMNFLNGDDMDSEGILKVFKLFGCINNHNDLDVTLLKGLFLEKEIDVHLLHNKIKKPI